MSGFKIKALINIFSDCRFIGDENLQIKKLASLTECAAKEIPEAVAWISDKNLDTASSNIKPGLLILSEIGFEKLKHLQCSFLISPNPRATFVKMVSLFFKVKREPGIEPTAIIHSSVKTGTNCYIGHHVIIEENCTLGNDVEILHNTVLLSGTIVGNKVRIGCNCTIGNYGFGYEKDEEGDYLLLEHMGNVVIHDEVEIHNNTCIDKGVMGSTVIGENVKIDNLVHVAHGVIIERNSLIIANAMLGGSCVIGENSWIAPSSSVKNKLKIAADTLTGIGAVVLKEFPEKQVLIGNPASTMEEYKAWSAVKKKLMKDQ